MRVSIRYLLVGVLAALAGLVALLNVIAGRALDVSEASTRAIVEDPVHHLEALKVVSDAYAVAIVDAAHKVRNGNTGWDEAERAVGSASDLIAARIAELSDADVGGDERGLLEQVVAFQAPADVAVHELRAIIEARDAGALDRFVRERLYQAIDPVTAAIGSFIDFQLVEARALERTASETVAGTRRLSMVLMIVSAILVLGGAGVVLMLVIRPLSALNAAVAKLAAGDLATAVPALATRTEIAELAAAFAVFRDRIAAAHGEKAAALHHTGERFARAIEDLTAQGRQMTAHAAAMASSVDSVGTRSQAVAEAAEQSRTNTTIVAAASEELAVAVREIMQRVTQATMVTPTVVSRGAATRERIEALSETADRSAT